jgi:hypothetical protein
MRTKKFLSVLLAAIMVVGVFGTVGAFAEEDIELQQAVAQQGWPTQIILTSRHDLARSWDAAVIDWIGFASTATGTAPNNGYVAQRGANPPTATRGWTVEGLNDAGAVVRAFNVHSNEAFARNEPQLRIHTSAEGGTERLVIQQGSNGWFGALRITLTVTARETETNTESITDSNFIVVRLNDQASFRKAIDDAKKILDRSSRYTDSFIKDLDTVVKAAENALVLDISVPANAVGVREIQKELEDMVASAPNFYQVLFIQSRLLGTIVYGIQDFYEAIEAVFEPVIRLFTAFFSIFGPMLAFLPLLLAIFL